MKKIILKVILGICVLAVATFAALIIRELIIDRQSRSFYDNLISDIETRPHDNEINSTPPGSSGSSTTDPDSSENPVEWQPFVDFSALNEKFPGIIGWILLDETPVDYPVMQYSDNDYFMTRLPDGTNHRNGSIFLDYRNEPDFSDKSILVYGHHTRAGDMFGTLSHYRSQEFYNANPVIYLFTPERDYELILFAGHLAHSVRDHPPLDFESDDDFLYYIQQLKNKSVFNSDVEVTAEDRIVSLVTCAYDFNEARLIVVGILR